MKLDKLFEKPTSRNLKILIIISLILCFTVIPVMQYFTTLSEYPAQIFSSQLSFNGDIMKSYYAITNIWLYRVAVSLDYIFMVGYGTILFSLSTLIARKFGKSSKVGKISVILAICGVIAACCDGIENIFILAMLSDPIAFPNYWAASHSIFALIKWILLFTGITWILIVGIISIIKQNRNRN
ncbi:MAG: hypothetical protein ACFFEY_20225 [Candidatus Thorarchaeota archaeon]